MDVKLLPIFDRLMAKYQAISAVSSWQSLQAATDLDQINAIIDERAVLLREILEINETLKAAGALENPDFQGKYAEIQSVIRDVMDSDKNMMDRITKRMNDIRDELKAKALFRTRALPGYIKQKYAFSK